MAKAIYARFSRPSTVLLLLLLCLLAPVGWKYISGSSNDPVLYVSSAPASLPVAIASPSMISPPAAVFAEAPTRPFPMSVAPPAASMGHGTVDLAAPPSARLAAPPEVSPIAGSAVASTRRPTRPPAAPGPSAATAPLTSGLGLQIQSDVPASLPILPGDAWRYFKGMSSAPPSAWDTVGFDDSTWLQGPSGFGYGDGDDATILSDMQQNLPSTPGYRSLYIRREFVIPDLGSIAGVKLTIDYDDSFVLYINGAEFSRH